MKLDSTKEQKKEMDRMGDYFEGVQSMAKELAPFQMKYVDFHRDFIKTLITLSAGVIGFSVPIFKNATMVTQKDLFLIALGGFLLTIVFGLAHLYDALRRDRKYLESTMKFWEETVRYSAIDLQKQLDRSKPEHQEQIAIEWMATINKKIHQLTWQIKQDEPFLKIQNWIFHCTFVSFVLSLLFIVISLI